MTMQSPEMMLAGRRLSPEQAVADLLAEFQVRLGIVMAREGVSEAELARRLGVSKRSVARMMGGTAKVSLATVARAFHALQDVPELTSAKALQYVQDNPA